MRDGQAHCQCKCGCRGPVSRLAQQQKLNRCDVCRKFPGSRCGQTRSKPDERDFTPEQIERRFRAAQSPRWRAA